MQRSTASSTEMVVEYRTKHGHEPPRSEQCHGWWSSRVEGVVSVFEREAVDDLSVDGEPSSQVQARRLTDQIRLGLESIWELALRA